MTSIKPATLRLAREWAEWAKTVGASDDVRAAIEVILSLPAPVPPAEIVLGGKAHHARIGEVVIASTKSNADGQVQVMWANGDVVESDWVSVCDLESVAPNGDKGGDRTEGSVPTPRPGEAWLISIDGKHYEAILDGEGEFPVADDGSTTFYDRQDVTPLARLVPETPRKVLATVEDYKDAPLNTVARHEPHNGYVAIEKWSLGQWLDTSGKAYTDAEMAEFPRTVLWEPEG